MTQLYRLDCSAADVARRFGARQGEDPWEGGYVAPLKFAPVITAGREFIAGPRSSGGRLQPRMTPRLWGVLPPPNADDPTRRIASVRNLDSPFWIGNLRNSEFRCLVPATSFMGWGSGTDYEGRRLKHWFAPAGSQESQRVFAIAGVWKDEEVPAFALLTREARGAPRAAGCTVEPIILPDDERARQNWLHGNWDMARGALESASVPLAEVASPTSQE